MPRWLFFVGPVIGLFLACVGSDPAPGSTLTVINPEGGPSAPSPPGSSNGDDAGGDASEGVDPSCLKMDIVFIIDDSGSMGEEQANLAANAPSFIAKLDALSSRTGAKIDYRVAVTTTGRTQTYTLDPGPPFTPQTVTEHGENGAFLQRADCGMTIPWIESSDPDRVAKFACAAQVGITGPSFEMPLEVFSLAVKERVTDGTNGGFLRDDALLAAVIITDADDCSRKDDNFTLGFNTDCTTANGFLAPGVYFPTFDGVKGRRSKWSLGVIAADQLCEDGSAEGAPRLRDFVARAGTNAAFSSICAVDLTPGLEKALATFKETCKTFALPDVDAGDGGDG